MIDYLYHYTDIETLALILANRTIRLNPLNKMDDLQEQETEDVKNFGRFFFISSWTDIATESIPMWKMYGSWEHGCRIKLRKCPFEIHKNTDQELYTLLGPNIVFQEYKGPLYSLIPFSEMIKNGYSTPGFLNEQEKILFKVEYTDDRNKLYPKILEVDQDQTKLLMGEMGKYKNKHWEFQSEWRYIVPVINIDMLNPDKALHDFSKSIKKIVRGVEKQPVPFIDLKLTEEAFSNMEVTLSPKISNGNRIIVQNLMKEYNQFGEIKESELLGLV